MSNQVKLYGFYMKFSFSYNSGMGCVRTKAPKIRVLVKYSPTCTYLFFYLLSLFMYYYYYYFFPIKFSNLFPFPFSVISFPVLQQHKCKPRSARLRKNNVNVTVKLPVQSILLFIASWSQTRRISYK